MPVRYDGAYPSWRRLPWPIPRSPPTLRQAPASRRVRAATEEDTRVLAKVYSCAVIGLDGVLVEVEVDVGTGNPGVVVIRP